MINEKAVNFVEDAYYNGEINKINLEDYKGKWVVLFFYPADFTFICPTELGELADHYEQFKNLNVEIISVSTDTAFVHKAWHDSSESIKKINFPMLADPTGRVSKAYGTYIENEGLSLRGTFIIDPDGNVKASEIHDNSIGRSSKELIRKIQAAQFVRNSNGKVCPASWMPGMETLSPGVDLIGKI
ncbi:peroxiredoxin [archaeon]|jgi:NADH-dependent peroxiredoxin subunit C|nr:peroxiredoxin [archaeon]MBT3731063.1 peroxiredoxin [archaeon]MBT4670176.1 peroxiredoxin [archaeon]MBT5030534.1 peroxiredoxin [archaeon]MBT5287887.1 peroxiredoxin [archaeon]